VTSDRSKATLPASAAPRDAASKRQSRPARVRVTLLAWASFLPLLGLWRSMARSMASRPRPERRHAVAGPLAEGLTVDGPVALWKQGETLAAVSLRCPHLGCRVGPSGDGTLVCPCHGSRFDGRGRVQSGPARGDLAPLPVTRGASPETVVVDLAG